MIFVNFKTYRQGTGEKAVRLAKVCQSVAEKTKVAILAVVQAADIYRASQQAKLPIWAQHVDDIGYGADTGQILPETIKAAGAQGTILNHSENKLPVETIKATIKRCRRVGLKTLVCVESLTEAQSILSVKPDFLAYEPAELIGSRTDSVASARSAVIKDFINQVSQLPVLVGAGIHSQKDIQVSLELGAKGILVATDIVLAKDAAQELLDLAKGFKKHA